MNQKIKIEIGSNSGKDTAKLLSNECLTIGFEPNPILYSKLIEKFKEDDRVIFLPIAIDVSNTIKDFNVSTQGDMGFGSLYDFHDNLKNTEIGNHEYFKIPFEFKQKVLTMRLDSFIINFLNSEISIEYLWIDSQGSDFNCLLSLGNYIHYVKEGRCECTYKIPLYKDVENSYEKVKEFLENHNFGVETIDIHKHESEIDLRFWKK
ncbi:MAG: FkbM family methyltransferase [Candidatus Paceibacterota bacterium]